MNMNKLRCVPSYKPILYYTQRWMCCCCCFNSLPNDCHWRWVWLWNVSTVPVGYIHLSPPLVLFVNNMGLNELNKCVYSNMVSLFLLRKMLCNLIIFCITPHSQIVDIYFLCWGIFKQS